MPRLCSMMTPIRTQATGLADSAAGLVDARTPVPLHATRAATSGLLLGVAATIRGTPCRGAVCAKPALVISGLRIGSRAQDNGGRIFDFGGLAILGLTP